MISKVVFCSVAAEMSSAAVVFASVGLSVTTGVSLTNPCTSFRSRHFHLGLELSWRDSSACSLVASVDSLAAPPKWFV